MARLLILDSEAVSALARRSERGVLRLRAAAITARARQDEAVIAVPLPVLAEVYRGDGSDVDVDRLVGSIRELPLTRSIARLAGQLRARAGQGSAVDAMVAATAIRAGGALIATGDSDDLRALAAGHPNVRVWAL